MTTLTAPLSSGTSPAARPVIRPVTGRRVLAWLLAAFGAIIVANLALIVFALNTFTGETQPKSYATGLDFNRTLDAVAAQHDLGWRVAGRVAPFGERQVKIDASYLDRDGRALGALTVVAEMSRPTVEGYDFEAPVAHQGGGQYMASVAVPLPGLWHVRLRAERADGEPYLLDYRVTVP
jgi:nitrogen fixation protein FixH